MSKLSALQAETWELCVSHFAALAEHAVAEVTAQLNVDDMRGRSIAQRVGVAVNAAIQNARVSVFRSSENPEHSGVTPTRGDLEKGAP